MLSKSYPRWLHPHMTKDGVKVLVQSAREEETYTGVEMNEDGTRKYAAPPTKEEIQARGYSPEAVERIFAQEQEKATARVYPYGQNEPGAIQGEGKASVDEAAQKAIDDAAAKEQEAFNQAAAQQQATANLDHVEPVIDHDTVADALGLGN